MWYRLEDWKVKVGLGLKSWEILTFLVGYSVIRMEVSSSNDAVEGRRNGRAGSFSGRECIPSAGSHQ